MKVKQLKHSVEEISTWGDDYKNGLSLSEIAKKYNVPYGTVKGNLLRFGYRKPSKVLKNQRVSSITYFDKIDSDEKAYYVGYMMADGYICKTPYGVSWGMGLQSSDQYILDHLKNTLKVSNKISKYKNSVKLSLTC